MAKKKDQAQNITAFKSTTKIQKVKKQRNVVICNMNSDSPFFTTKRIPERI